MTESIAPSLFAPEIVARIQQAFVGSSLIVAHRFLFGGRAPECRVFDDYEDFMDYVAEFVRDGDALEFWRYNDVCREDNAVLYAKKPDADGNVFQGGAY